MKAWERGYGAASHNFNVRVPERGCLGTRLASHVTLLLSSRLGQCVRVYVLAVVRFAVFLLTVTVRQAIQKDMPEREEASELQEIFPRTFCSMVKPGY